MCFRSRCTSERPRYYSVPQLVIPNARDWGIVFTLPGYIQPWEDQSHLYPGNFASPLNIAIEASNGASDYGNKFGEPVLAGFARSYGLTDLSGERREYIKPIMFSGGIGQLEDIHVKKNTPETGTEGRRFGIMMSNDLSLHYSHTS